MRPKHYAPVKQTHRKGRIADHGTRTRYVQHKCRCDECRKAIRDYERVQRRLRGYEGFESDWEDALVDAGEARKYLCWLASNGISLRIVEELAGIGRSALAEIKSGRRKRIYPATSDKILAVSLSDRLRGPGGHRIPAAETWRLIDEMLAAGFTKAFIGSELGQKGPSLQLSRNFVTLRNARGIQKLHDRLFHENARGEKPHCHGGVITGRPFREACNCLGNYELEQRQLKDRLEKRAERSRKAQTA